jgi:hypothetical protein
MAVGGGAVNGQYPATTALPAIGRQAVTFAGGGGTTITPELISDGCAWFNVYVNKISGAGAVTVFPEFADGVDVGGAPLWHPYTSAAGLGPLVAATPSLTNYHLGARRHRLRIVSTAGAVVDYRITASAT